jgi:hypothetical protein
MGRNGISPAFGPTDQPTAMSDYARSSDLLGHLVDDVVEAEHRVGIAMARRAHAIESARSFSEELANRRIAGASSARSIDLAHRAFVSEVGAALRIPDRTAERLIRTSQSLVNDLPETLLALGEGRLTYRHAQILVDQGYGLDPASLRELESRMLPVAQKNTPSRFEQSVRKTRERLNPESMVERHTKAVAERGTELVPEQDGMAFIGAHVSAVLAVAIDERVTAIARSRQGADEDRTLGELKADVFTDILLDVDGLERTSSGLGSNPIARYRSIRPSVLLTVPALTLLNQSNEPGIIEGYGPIDRTTARQITSFSKTMRRLITDPVTGIVLSMDRRRYRIPKDLRIWLRVRDGTCRFPGCNRNAGKAEIDHTNDWALGGKTNYDNLACLCPGHHTLKGIGDWKVKQLGGGRLLWTSPTNIPYETEPDIQFGPAA